MPRILHVDDEPFVRKAIKRVLESAGMRVRSVGTAGEAEQVAREASFDVAVIDRHIGDDDGLELIEHFAIRYPKLRLILLSGSLTPSVEERAYALGAARCLSKTTPPRQLIAEVFAFAGGSGIVSFDEPLNVRGTGS